VLLLVLMVANSGCWDRIEVNDLAMVQGVALDKVGPDTLELTVALAVPAMISPPGSMGGGAQQAPPLATKTGHGRTVMEALSKLQEKVERRLHWAHNQVLLISEELAREGVLPVLDFFARQREPRLRTVVAVVPGRAADVLAVIQSLEPNVPMAIRDLEELRTGVFITLKDFLAMLASEGQDPVAARIEIVPAGARPPGQLGGQGQSGQGGKAQGGPEGPPQVAVTGAAVFKDDRLVGFLDDRLTRGVLWLRDELQTATVTISLGDSGKWVSFNLVRAETRLKPRFEGERIIMEVKIETEDDLNDNAAGVDAGDPEVLRLLQEELARRVAARVSESARVVQKKFKSDIFGFGEAVRRADPKRWQELKERWDEVFPQVEIALKIKTRIRRTGLSTKPLGREEKKVIKAEELRKLLRGK